MRTILGMIIVGSLFLACAEAETWFIQILWSGTMLTICAISAKAFEKKYMTKEELEEKI